MRTWIAVLGCCFSVLISAPSTWPQEFLWAIQLGGTSFDDVWDVAVDTNGYVYTVGIFEGTADFDPGPGTFNLTSAGGFDVFVSKLDSNRDFVWARRMGGTEHDNAFGLALDASGNVYTVGTFNGTADFDPGPETFNLTSSGFRDVFVSKLDGAGNFLWAVRLGGTSDDLCSEVAVDMSGNVYTVGDFDSTADFDPGPGTFNLTPAGLTDFFVSKLDSNGDFLWANRMGGTLNDFSYGVAVDMSGNVYTVGTFYGTADFDPGPGTFNLTPGSADVFVSKLDSDGNFVWAVGLGGTLDDFGLDVVVDSSGNVHTVGFFQATADFDPGPGTFNLTAAGFLDVFVSKLDANGNFLWARGHGGTSLDQGWGVALDSSGNVYTVGDFDSTADFDPGPGTFNLTPAGLTDSFVSKLDGAGNFLWAVRLGGTSRDQGRGVAVDSSGNVHTVGFFEATADFDPGPGTYNLTPAGEADIFITKLDGAVAAGDVAALAVQHATGGDITLSWGDSCASTDDDYAIYEGTIGSWYSHLPRFCSTGGSTTATFSPAAGDTYYVVVPRNALREGSYGAASDGTPRPRGSGACAVQLIAHSCP